MQEITVFAPVAAEREQLFTDLYQKAFPAVAKYVRRMGGSLEEAKDIFQDALVLYYERAVTDPLVLSHGERAYILGIARHLWIRRYKDNRYIPLDHSGEGLQLAEEDPGDPASVKLLQFLETSGQKCMEILQAFYYEKLPVAKIAALFGYSGVRSATVQKYKCLEKVRDKVKEKSLTYEDFLE